MRLWLADEARAITNRQEFSDSLVDQAVKRLNAEPIDIYAFPTYLLAAMRAEADRSWTERRMTNLIDALLKSQVAVEISTREHLPNRVFLELIYEED